MCIKKPEMNMIKLKELMKNIDHRMNKKEKTKHNLALLSVNHEHGKLMDETKGLLMAFD